MSKRDNHFAKVKEYKERFSKQTTEALFLRLSNHRLIKEAAIAAERFWKSEGFQILHPAAQLKIIQIRTLQRFYERGQSRHFTLKNLAILYSLKIARHDARFSAVTKANQTIQSPAGTKESIQHLRFSTLASFARNP